MALSTPRLYRKPETGVYFVRVLFMYPTIAAADDGGPRKGPNKVDVRRSLRTRNPKLAGKIVALLNAALAQIPMSSRPALFDDLHKQVVDRFVRPDGQVMHIEDREDMENFVAFFKDLGQPGLEDFRGAFTERVAERGIYTESPAFTVRDAQDRAVAIELMKELAQPDMADLKEAMLARLRGRRIAHPTPPPATQPMPPVPVDPIHPFALPQEERPTHALLMASPAATSDAVPLPAVHAMDPRQTTSSVVSAVAVPPQANTPFSALVLPPNPTPWHTAVASFRKSMTARKKGNAETIDERVTVLDQLHEFMVQNHRLKDNFKVHEIQHFHISAFLDDSASRPARGVTLQQKEEARRNNTALPTIAASTLLKRVTALEVFFKWAQKDAGFTTINAADGQDDRREDLNKTKAEESESYDPFSAEQMQVIFDPVRFMSQCRDADHFWAPLLSAHLGGRLGEFVNVELSQIQRDTLSGHWYLAIKPEDAKNANSVRKIPITEPLVKLGFIDYVEKLKELGATTLFPHRYMKTSSAIAQPSRNVSEKFSRYLNVCGIVSKTLVFHSFRHTLVNSLIQDGVPIALVQQLVGHMAQDEAIRLGLMSQKQARGVTLKVYTHRNIAGINGQNQLDALKCMLEDNYKLPLDYDRLKIAAAILLRHVRKDRKSETGFDCGWAPQNKAYTTKMVQEILDACPVLLAPVQSRSAVPVEH